MDLPVWQALHEELQPHGLTVITVALDANPEDARPWIEAARPTHPSLIDVQHRLADLYGIVNVPTTVWIDERGTIVRPNDVVFATDTYRHITGMDSAKSLNAIRDWVLGRRPPLSPDQVRAHQRLPDAQHQQARAEAALALWLHGQGQQEAAERHFARAGELAPHDWTIRRGSMRLRNRDPFGPDFRQMRQEWAAQGHSYYLPLPE